MEKTNYSQLELFSQIRRKDETKTHLPNSFIYYMRGYEKTIIIIIVFIITGIISFSLGVEKGKEIVNQKTNSRIDMAEVSQPAKSSQIAEVNYAIQVASYETRVYAQKEAEVLKKKGLSPSVLSKGRFVVLYVGNFPDEKSAKSVLTELKKQYRDCFIRRL